MQLMHIPESAVTLERDLRGIFGNRLQSMIVYGSRAIRADQDRPVHAGSDTPGHAGRALTHTMAVVDVLSTDDLRVCSSRMEACEARGLAAPLLLAASEFGRSLDAFPFEFGAILNDYTLVSGSNPFDGLQVQAADLRRACEVEARGHLLHLREGYLETYGRGDAIAVLIADSAPAFAALVANVAYLDAVGGSAIAAARHVERKIERPATASQIVSLVGVNEITSAEAERLFAPYLDTVQRLVAYIDAWTA
jgi:hypothetical protein